MICLEKDVIWQSVGAKKVAPCISARRGPPVKGFTGYTYLRPDISKGITTHNKRTKPQNIQYLIYDLTYQKGLRPRASCSSSTVTIFLSTTWHIKRDYDILSLISSHLSAPSYLRPDISKGITTFPLADSQTRPEQTYLRPDISKGITTNLNLEMQVPNGALSTTWHIKRDYDISQAPNTITAITAYLRPDISKGITTLFLSFFVSIVSGLIYDLTYQKGLRLTVWTLDKPSPTLSTTWHIKRDYDFCACVLFTIQYLLIYDLTYQKGLRHNSIDWLNHLCRTYLRPDISKGITTCFYCLSPSTPATYLRPDISKGITTFRIIDFLD